VTHDHSVVAAVHDALARSSASEKTVPQTNPLIATSLLPVLALFLTYHATHLDKRPRIMFKSKILTKAFHLLSFGWQ
jgi:hypothetical protein